MNVVLAAFFILMALVAHSSADVETLQYGMFDDAPLSFETCGLDRNTVASTLIPSKADPNNYGFVTKDTILCVLQTRYGAGAVVPDNMFEVCDHDGDGRWSFAPSNELMPSTAETQCNAPEDCCLMNCAALSAYMSLVSGPPSLFIACASN